MNITVEHKGKGFNVHLASKEGAEPFLTIKGCRIVDSAKGAFVSWPATKNDSTGKWWNHVWANDKFAAAVMAKAQESMPQRVSRNDDDGDAPF